MKKALIITATLFALTLATLPYIIGKVQYNNVIRTTQNFGNECNDDFDTDGEIENVLRVYDFQIGVFDNPSFADYYTSGFNAIKELL